MDASGDRSQFFPAIEKKHGVPISSWIERLAELGDAKYPEQIAYLRENHGFSQAQANALVMHVRGSASSKRFATPADFFDSLDPVAAATAEAIFECIVAAHPELELVIAWNQPMLRAQNGYVVGLSVAKAHILINPFSAGVLSQLSESLQEYDVKKRTFSVPLDWKVDAALLRAVVVARLAELAAT